MANDKSVLNPDKKLGGGQLQATIQHYFDDGFEAKSELEIGVMGKDQNIQLIAEIDTSLVKKKSNGTYEAVNFELDTAHPM